MSDAPSPPRVPISIWILWFLFVSQCAALAVHVWRNHELAGLHRLRRVRGVGFSRSLPGSRTTSCPLRPLGERVRST